MSDPTAQFTPAESRAYQWLIDRQVDIWLLDMKTRRVTASGKEYSSLVEFAEHHGCQP